jgi:hypothetical protein
MSGDPANDQASGQAGARAAAAADRARSRTMKNMIGGLLACLAVVALLGLVVQRPAQETVHAIDYSGQLAMARKVAPYPVLAPDPMPSGWRATSAQAGAESGKPFTWHLGVITPDRRYIGLEQSNGAAGRFVSDTLGETNDAGTSTIGGNTWQRTASTTTDDHALVRTADGATTILISTADYSVLDSYAATLTASNQ